MGKKISSQTSVGTMIHPWPQPKNSGGAKRRAQGSRSSSKAPKDSVQGVISRHMAYKAKGRQRSSSWGELSKISDQIPKPSSESSEPPTTDGLPPIAASVTLKKARVGPWHRVDVSFMLNCPARQDDFIGLYHSSVPLHEIGELHCRMISAHVTECMCMSVCR